MANVTANTSSVKQMQTSVFQETKVKEYVKCPTKFMAIGLVQMKAT